jgi:hypothetical protein
MYLEEAEVCDEVDDVYGPYINKLYNERRVYKMILKAYEKELDAEKVNK